MNEVSDIGLADRFTQRFQGHCATAARSQKKRNAMLSLQLKLLP
jgi:hypothetical protein